MSINASPTVLDIWRDMRAGRQEVFYAAEDGKLFAFRHNAMEHNKRRGYAPRVARLVYTKRRK